MHNVHSKNTVRYYLLVLIFLSFLFFSNNFGLIDVQKTAIVMATGIDREDDVFIVTSQIAIPQSSKQGKQTEAVQLVSRGKTIAEAFDEINAKTGWYPKLVFCNLILLGENTATQNVFDALDFFLLDEYLSDNCQVAVCKGLAKDILNTTALVDPSTSTALAKILSPHAERVGSAMPSTLRDFAIGYFGESKSGFLPVIKIEPQQEKIGKIPTESSSSSEMDSQSGQDKNAEQKNDKPVFSARETALFVDGKWVETLNSTETFAVSAVLNTLRLADYSVETSGATCTLSIKNNDKKTKLDVGENGDARLKIQLTLSAGVVDFSRALPVDELADVGDVPNGAFANAEKKLSAEIKTAFEKSKAVRCDLFGVRERLLQYGKRKHHVYKDVLLSQTSADVCVRFRGVR